MLTSEMCTCITESHRNQGNQTVAWIGFLISMDGGRINMIITRYWLWTTAVHCNFNIIFILVERKNSVSRVNYSKGSIVQRLYSFKMDQICYGWKHLCHRPSWMIFLPGQHGGMMLTAESPPNRHRSLAAHRITITSHFPSSLQPSTATESWKYV